MPPPSRLLVAAKWGTLCLAALVAGLAFVGRPLTAPLSGEVEIARMTWVEVRGAVARGATTVLVPSGGIEQNGIHMVTGKHDRIVGWAARRIAEGLGRTLVAPVISYVPQGAYDPPEGHLRYPGTIGVPDAVFAGTLEGIARSLKGAGFRTIGFLADHGASTGPQREVAERLSREWAPQGVRVVDVSAYYDDAAQLDWLRAAGETMETIGRHAGIQDTSELMAIWPEGVDLDRLAGIGLRAEATGAGGDPSRASAERGRTLIDMRVRAAVAQIEDARGAARAAGR
ncbi:creatininase family protein [Methylobacterium sp. J-078]|uniref:creatininase family protein n=1 Tax=Methylobacterium sp. J-078 TaxID=2836657 RepID=UPI001FB9CD02|nr:creatininase family protein [Methylobacterium sp. J-078]MCJ2047279.1 creatininase family protein [Methylobacterium sp. J-078]